MKIKICGITRREDAEVAIAAGADLVGFIFVPGTPRALDPEMNGWIRELDGAERVGVFRDAPLEEIFRVRNLLELDRVQLHGAEPEEFLRPLGTAVIRRVTVGKVVDWHEIAALSARCLPLFDPGAGDGRVWSWEILARRPEGIDFGLAGGLDPSNVADAIRVVRPSMIDVSSGVENTPRRKEVRLVRAFIDAARSVGG